VVYQGIEAGRVTALQLNKDGRSVDMTLRLMPRAKPALVEGTTFYFVGAGNSITDVSALHAALAGVTIGVIPKFTGRPTRHFPGLEHAPIYPPGTSGVPLVLTLSSPGAIQPGNNVTYHGVDVGKITSVRLTGLQSAEVGAFVEAPYDRFVRPDSVFWNVGALQLSLSSEGINTHVNPAALLHGEVAFDTPESAEGESRVPDRSRFPLYPDDSHADSAPSGPQVLYRTRFNVPVNGLAPGSRVTWHGLSVGVVRDIAFAFDSFHGTMSSTVTFAISPRLLHLEGATVQPNAYWRRRIDRAMASLVAHGWRFRIAQAPPLVGARALDLEMSDRPGTMERDGDYPTVPSEDGEGDVVEKATQLLGHLDRIPFAEIGANVKQASSSLNRLVSSPELRDTVKHLDGTMTQLNAIAAKAEPQIGPLLAKLNLAADQLQQVARTTNGVVGGQGASNGNVSDALREISDAARSVRSLTDYLSRHPEAILKGKAKDR